MTIQEVHLKLEQGYYKALEQGKFDVAQMYLEQFEQSLQLILRGDEHETN